jgi:hypothetical protein
MTSTAPAKRDERHLRFLEHWDHRHRRTRGRTADHGNDLVVFDQTGREGAGLVGVAAVVVDHQLDLLASHSASGVDLLDVHAQRLVFWLTQKRRRSRHRQHRSDLDRLLRESRTTKREPGDRECKGPGGNKLLDMRLERHFFSSLWGLLLCEHARRIARILTASPSQMTPSAFFDYYN